MNGPADVLLLGVDGGGSGCRARLCTISGRTLSEGSAGSANIRLGVEQSFASVHEATVQCMSAAGLSTRDFDRIVACLALAGASEPSQLEAARQHEHPYRSAVFVTDAQAGVRTSLPSATPWTSFPNLPIDPHFKDGYSQQWHVEIQRQITPNLVISAAYVGSKNGRLDYQGKANTAPLAFPAGTPASTIDAQRPMPWVDASIGYEQSIGYSRYNALEVRLQRRFANGLTSLLSYTWGKSLDVSSGYFGVENGAGGGSAVQNYYDQNSNRGVSGFDITHFLSWATVYELPAGRGKRWFRSGPASWILGNWQANYIFQARSGQPFTIRTTGDIANISGSGGVRAQNATGYGRPNIIADPFQPGPVPANPDVRCQKTISQGGRAADATRTPATWFNPCAFTVPSGSCGNLGRTPYRGSAVVNMDFSMFKSIPLPREGMALQLRFEAFNVFNIQNWDTPTTANSDSGLTVNSAAFGLINTLAQGTTPRELQFGLRFVF